MAIENLQTLLNRIPMYYNKTEGKVFTSLNVNIPAVPNSPTVTIGSTEIAQGSSDIVQIMSSVGFSLDFLFENIQTLKDISYIGAVPVPLVGNNTPGALFSGPFEGTALPGNIFIMNQNVSRTDPYTIPDFINNNATQPTYMTLINGGTFPFTCIGITLQPGQYQVYVWNKLTQWLPAEITGFDPVSGLYTVSPPKNAVNVPGPIFPGFTSPDLDQVGANFGVPRILTESDVIYRKRINQSVTGNKLTPGSIVNQFRIIYGLSAQVYQWFPSSAGSSFLLTYDSLVTYLTSNPGYTAFYLDGTPVPDNTYPLDLTASQGPTNTFYVVISGNGLLTFQNGVYPDDLTATPPDWTFVDYEDTTIGPGHHGGFFVPNVGEPDFTLSAALFRYLHLISTIKAAGTEGILVVTP